MVDTGNIAGSAFDMVGGFFSGTIYLILAILIASLVIALALYVHHRRKFDITAMIMSDRADERFSVLFDKAAMLLDKKTGNRYLKLLKNKKELPLPPYNLLEKTNKGDMIMFWRKGEDDFIPITQPEINNQVVLRQDGNLYPIGQVEYKQVEGDIAYWNTKRKDIHKKMFDKEHILMKLLPFFPMIIGGAFTIFVLYILFDNVPALIDAVTQLAERLTQLAAAEAQSVG